MASVIDLTLCGIGPDGTPTYGSQAQGLGFECGRVVCAYPRETITALAVLAVVALCVGLAVKA